MAPEDRYDSLIQYYGERHGVPWLLMKRQMIAESTANPRAVSPGGDKGLMQFTDGTWAEFGQGDPFNPEASIEAAARYLRHLYDRFGEIPDPAERWKFACASYHTGPAAVNRALALARQSCGQPESFTQWVAAGRPAGRWQQWAYTRQFLSRVTGGTARITEHYVDQVAGGPLSG